MIGVQELVKKHGEHTVLRGVSLDVEEGSATAVVGPSGSGKTTLLRCMHGLDPFDGGTVRIGDATLRAGPQATQAAELRKVRARAGFVFQQWHLFAHMTVLENVIEAPVRVRGKPKPAAIEHARTLLTKVGLAHREHAVPRSLSGGEQQRAAIARALAMEPSVLLMDEPTSALDPQRIGALLDLLGGLREDGLTVVVVTHDIDFARRLAQRAVVMADGEVVEEGDPSELLVDPKNPRVRAFLDLE